MCQTGKKMRIADNPFLKKPGYSCQETDYFPEKVCKMYKIKGGKLDINV